MIHIYLLFEEKKNILDKKYDNLSHFQYFSTEINYNFLMYQKKKERLYICDLLEDPALTYPSYYVVSSRMMKNEMLHAALVSLHSFDLSWYETPKSFDDIFKMFDSGTFPIYKEKYIIGYFGSRMMFLESNGWKGMPATADIFKLENWLVC